MLRALIASVILVFAASAFSQPLTLRDFAVGRIHLKARLDSVTQNLGPAIDTTKIETESGPFFWLRFKGLSIWTDASHSIAAIDISSSAYRTSRGVKIGDSLAYVERSYGPKKGRDFEKVFEREYKIYDTRFVAYNYYVDYELHPNDNHAYYIDFFIRGGHVVKIYLYVGLMD